MRHSDTMSQRINRTLYYCLFCASSWSRPPNKLIWTFKIHPRGPARTTCSGCYTRCCLWCGERNQKFDTIYITIACRKISWILETTKLVIHIIIWHWHSGGTSATELPIKLVSSRATELLYIQISQFWDFLRSCVLAYWVLATYQYVFKPDASLFVWLQLSSICDKYIFQHRKDSPPLSHWYIYLDSDNQEWTTKPLKPGPWVNPKMICNKFLMP